MSERLKNGRLPPSVKARRAVWPLGTRLQQAPVFQCDTMPGTGSYAIGGSPWSGHRRFVHDLMGWWRPRRVIDLGVHWGCSTFAFAQAIKDYQFECELIGVDTFHGDEHAGLYGEEVYEFVQDCATHAYKGVRIRIERSTFDEALPTVADESVDIIHFDGLHTYAALKHDTERWLPKLARDGMMLLHDIKPEHPYGSERFWAEVSSAFPSMAFHHSWGLGMLFPRGDRIYRAMLGSQFPRWLSWYAQEDRRRRQSMIADNRSLNLSATTEQSEEDPAPDTSDQDWWRYRCRARTSGQILRRLGGGDLSRILILSQESPAQLVELHLAMPGSELQTLGTLACDSALRASLPRLCTESLTPLNSLPSGAFDAVISFAAIERRRRPDLVMKSVTRCLRPGGVLLASSPSMLWCYLESRRLEACHWRPPPVLMRSGFERACRGAGLSIQEHGRFMLAPLSDLARRGMPDRAARLMRIEPLLDRIPFARFALANRYFVATRD